MPNFISFGGKKMADQEKSLNITWSQFEVCNPDTRTAFENMCRFLFNIFFFEGKGLFHSDPNNPGIEIVPILHEESGQWISFQAKFFSSLKNAYSQIKDSAKQAIKYYEGKLDVIYLYCNKDLSTSSKSYQDILNLLSSRNISLIPITNRTILDQVLCCDIAWSFFGAKSDKGTERLHQDEINFNETFNDPAIGDIKHNAISLDHKLNIALDEITTDKINPLEYKILEAKSRKFINQLQEGLEQIDKNGNKTPIQISPRTLCPIERQIQTDGMGIGKHFSLPELPEHKWLIFEVYTVNNYATFTREYDVELLDSICEQKEDGKVLRTFFIDDPQENGNQIIILCFAKNEVFINLGILAGNEVRLTKHPDCFVMHPLFRDKDGVLYLSETAYNLSKLTKEEKESLFSSFKIEKGQWHQASVDSIPPIIIDPENAEIVKRELYYDEYGCTWASRINIIPYKNYFAFKIKPDNSNTNSRPLTALEIGTYYRFGTFGFPKNPILAIRYLTEDGSAEALYQIAQVFRDETEFQDKDVFLKYLQQSADRNYGLALLELAIYYYCEESSIENRQKIHILLKRAIINNCQAAYFFFAYFTEIGLFLKCELKEAFDFYFEAAENGYKPAQFRLSRNWENDKKEPDKLYQQFLDSANAKDGTAQFCAGSALFFGLLIADYQEKGLSLLVEAAELGNYDAQYELLNLYDSAGDYEDEESALK